MKVLLQRLLPLSKATAVLAIKPVRSHSVCCFGLRGSGERPQSLNNLLRPVLSSLGGRRWSVLGLPRRWCSPQERQFFIVPASYWPNLCKSRDVYERLNWIRTNFFWKILSDLGPFAVLNRLEDWKCISFLLTTLVVDKNLTSPFLIVSSRFLYQS